jgi:DNA polymerase-3 subunit delta'
MVIGHQKIVQFLNRSRANDRLAHAYLFVGAEHLGKKTVAMEFAKTLQCEKMSQGVGGSSQLFFCGQCHSCQEIDKGVHPDVLIIEPEIVEARGKTRESEIGIGKIRDIRRSVSLFPCRGPHRIIIINQAESLTREAANAFLKTLEEPTPKTIMILISSNYQNLLPTIVSRCLLIKFLPVGNKFIKEYLSGRQAVSGGEADRVLRYAAGRPGVAVDYFGRLDISKEQMAAVKDLLALTGKDLSFKFQYAETLSKDIEAANRILSQWIAAFRDLLLSSAGCGELAVGDAASAAMPYDASLIRRALRKTMETKNLLSNTSLNSRLILEGLMLDF